MSTYSIRVATIKLNDTKTRFKLPVFIQVFVAKPSGIKRFGNRENNLVCWNGTTLADNKCEAAIVCTWMLFSYFIKTVLI